MKTRLVLSAVAAVHGALSPCCSTIKYKELMLRSLASCVVVLVGLGSTPISFAAPAEKIDVTITGKLKIVQIDNEPEAGDHGTLMYLLEDQETRKTFTLRFANKAPRYLRSGMTVTARGTTKGQELLLAAEGVNQQSITVATSPETVVSGEQKTLVIVANLSDASVTCSTDSIRDLMFNGLTSSVDGLYRETSYSAISFTGQVVGPYALSYSGSSCDSTLWANAADAAAQADGINLSAFPRKVYVMPSICSVAGIGEVGNNPSRAWVFRCDLADVFAHELGHNLGMQHAATPSGVYGDISDIMGGSGRPLRQINAPHKEQMGWIPPQEVVAVTNDGNYAIAPLELNPLNTVAPPTLKIFKPDTNEHYYLSYRQRIGFDVNLDLFSYLDRTSVHSWSGAGNTNLVAVLADGESFVDSVNGITFTQMSHTADHATTQVRFDNTCRPALPTVSLSPSSQNANPGGTLSYTVSVTNSDSTNCSQTVFNLRHSVPSGWTGSASPTSLALLPGGSGQASLPVTSPAGATAGNYTVGVNVWDTNQPNRTVSVSGTYSLVLQPDLTSPTAPTGLSAAVNRKGVSLSWSASHDNVGVSGYKVFRNGFLSGSTTSLSYVDGSTTSGATYQYFVKAFDAAGNVSASSNTTTVTIGGGSSGGSGGGKGGPKP